MKLIGALKAAKRTAPFYSAVDEALAAIKRPKGTGAEFYTELTKQAGVKKAELADRKLEQAFKAKGKMTKEEAQQVLAENPPPNLKERVYDESTAIDEADIREAVAREMFDMPFEDITNGREYRRVMDEVYRRMNDDLGTKFGKWKTPNGENYREILLKLPVQGDDAKKLNEISMILHGVPYTRLTGDTSNMAKLRLAVKREYKNIYYSPKTDALTVESYFNKYENSDSVTPGFTMSLRTRPLVINKFREYVGDRSVTIKSKRLVEEMKVFIWCNGRAEAQSGYNDDLVMSFGIGMYLRDTSLKFRQQSQDLTRAALGGISKPSPIQGAYFATGRDNPYLMDDGKGGKENFSWMLD